MVFALHNRREGPSLHRRCAPIAFDEIHAPLYEAYEVELASSADGRCACIGEVRHVNSADAAEVAPPSPEITAGKDPPSSPLSPRSVASIFDMERILPQSSKQVAPSLCCYIGSFSFDDENHEKDACSLVEENSEDGDFGCCSEPASTLRSILRQSTLGLGGSSCIFRSQPNTRRQGVRFSDKLVSEKTIPAIDEEEKSSQFYSRQEVQQFREEERKRDEEETKEQDTLHSMFDVYATFSSCSDSLSYYSGAFKEVPLMSVFNLDEE